MRLFIYQFVLLLLTPVLVFATIHQAIKRQGGILFVLQRFGISLPKLTHIDYWFHCASIGEVKTALPLINKIAQKKPNSKILISTNTPSGKYVLQHILDSQIQHAYLTWDIFFLINRFLSRIKAKQLIIAETEIWPMLYNVCYKRNIDISIINARLSNKTLSAPKIIKRLYKDSLLHCRQILCQSDIHVKSYQSLCDKANVYMLGNLKLYSENEKRGQNGILRTLTDKPYITLISSHRPEELKVAKALFSVTSDILLLIIPRHIERRQEIKSSLTKQGFKIALRSQQDTIFDNTQIYLADTIGEVPDLIKDTLLCIIGGSFIPHGGQNFLEAATQKKAIVCGPYMHNFQEITDFYTTQNALQQTPIENLPATLKKLIENPQERTTLEVAVSKLQQQNQHILQNYINAIE